MRIGTLPCFLLILSFWPLLSQDALDANQLLDMSLEELMEVDVVTASKKSEKSGSAPATIHVITEANIQARGYRNLKDLLEDIPEVEIQSRAVAEFNNYYSIRGISGNERFILLLNGFRFNSPTGTPHVIENNYPLLNVARVEVILGPASALYGADAFGGVVNIITKDAEKQGAELALSVGRYGTNHASLVFAQKVGNLAITAVGNGYESDEPDFPNLYPDAYSWYNNEYRNQGLALISPFFQEPITLPTSLQNRDYETPTRAEYMQIGLRVGDFEFQYARNRESHSSSTGMRPEFNLFVSEAIFQTTLESLSARHSYREPGSSWALESSAWKGSYSLDPNSRFLNTFTGYRDGFKYESDVTTKFEEQLTIDLNQKSSLIFGLSYEDVRSLPKTGDLPFAYDPAIPSESQGLYYIGTNVMDRNGQDLTVAQRFFNVEYQNKAAYLQYQLSLNKFIDLTAGLRYDKSTRYGATTNPRVGLVFSPREKMKLKLLYGQGFQAPSPYVSLQHYGSFVTVDEAGNSTEDPTQIAGLFGPFWHLPNPDLEPEKLTTWEASASFYLSSVYGLFINAYHNQVEQRVVNSAQFGLNLAGIPVGFAEVPVNVGTSTSYGGSVRINALLRPGAWTVNAHLAYSYSDGEVDDGPLIYSARDTLRAVAELKRGAFTLTPRFLYRSPTTHFLTDAEGNHYQNPGYGVLHLYSSWDDVLKMGRIQASLFVRVDNLLDRRYTNTPLAQGEGFSATPQDPRRYSFGLKLKL